MQDTDSKVAIAERAAARLASSSSGRYTGADLLASAWVGVERAAKAYQAALGDWPAFAYALARHSAVDQMRQEGRQSRPFGNDEGTESVPTGPVLTEQALRSVLSGMLDLALVKNVGDRQVAHLRWVDGMSVTEVAAELEITEDAVKSRSKRTRSAMDLADVRSAFSDSI